jgi:hypothetical protein
MVKGGFASPRSARARIGHAAVIGSREHRIPINGSRGRDPSNHRPPSASLSPVKILRHQKDLTCIRILNLGSRGISFDINFAGVRRIRAIDAARLTRHLGRVWIILWRRRARCRRRVRNIGYFGLRSRSCNRDRNRSRSWLGSEWFWRRSWQITITARTIMWGGVAARK